MSLQIWLPLIKNCQNQGLMECNVQDTSEITATFINGKIGQCLNSEKEEFNFDIPDLQNIIGPQRSWSIACWIKFKRTTGSGYLLTLDLTAQHSMYFNLGSDPRLVWNENSDSGKRILTLDLNDIATRWYHVVVTFKKDINNSIIETTYIDGLQTYQKTWVSTKQQDVTYSKLTLFSTNGYFNDIRIYNHCLSQKEVEEISKGLVLHYKLDSNGIGNPNLLLDTNAPSLTKVNADYDRYIESSSSGTYTITWETIPDPPAPGIINGVRESVSAVSSFHSVVWYSGSLINVVVGNTYTMSCYVKIISGSDLLFTFQYGKSPYVADTQTLINDHEWHQYSWTFVPNDSAAANGTTRIYLGGLKAIGEVLICGWKLEEGDQATSWCLHDDEMSFNLRDKVYDCSGYNNTGTYSSGTFKAEINSPRYILAHKFPRNLMHSAIWVNDNYLNEFTISFWLKSWDNTATTSGGLIYYGVVSCYIGAATGSYPNRLMFGWYQGKSDVNTYSANTWATAIVVPKDLWQYYTITFNKGLLKCYTNGEYVNQSDRTDTGNSIRANYTSSNQVGNSLHAYLSDLRIYATALTENQIKELYNISMSIDNNGNIYSRELVE